MAFRYMRKEKVVPVRKMTALSYFPARRVAGGMDQLPTRDLEAANFEEFAPR